MRCGRKLNAGKLNYLGRRGVGGGGNLGQVKFTRPQYQTVDKVETLHRLYNASQLSLPVYPPPTRILQHTNADALTSDDIR